MSTLGKGEWLFLNDRGFSWAETILSLLMLFMLFGSLLPLMQRLQQSIHLKQERMIAYETLHEAAREILDTGNINGIRTINGTEYRWNMDSRLCVEYPDFRGSREKVCAE